MNTEPPGTVRAAVAVWSALGVFGLVNVAFLWLRRDGLEQDAARAGFEPGAVTTLLAQLTAVAVVFGVGYVVLARLLRARKRWVRGVLTAVALVHVLWLLLTGAAAANVVVLLLIAAGCALTWLPGTAEWVKQH